MSDYLNDLFSHDEDGENLNNSEEINKTDKAEKVENVEQTPQQNSGEYHYAGTGNNDNVYSSRPYTSHYSEPYTQQNTQQNTNTYANPYTQQSAQQYTPPYTAQPTNPYGNTPEQTTPKKKKEKKGASKGFVAVMLVICVLLSSLAGFGGAMLYTKMKVSDTEISTNGAMIINKVDIDEQTADELADKTTSQITDEVADCVVEITTEVMSTSQFYGQYISQGAGSGVIISSDGYIVTNNHVIDGASSITVTLRDQTSYDAVLIGKDSVVDIALLKIEATDLKAATFGDSDDLEVGDKAVAIGNPLGQLGGTVTEGIISALDRDVVIDDETMNLLQTDTAINPGNSGGGLFDGQGALVGIVVAKSSGEEIEGLGFAIPINDVIDILDDLKEYGYVRGRVSVGMELIDLSNSMYSMYYYGNEQGGCYVYSVNYDSAAYNAGIQQGDRIVSIDGTEVSSTDDVETALEGKAVGDVVEVEIERGGRTATVEITLDEYVPDDVVSSQSNNSIINPFA